MTTRRTMYRQRIASGRALLFAIAAAAFGCPSTESTPISLERIEVLRGSVDSPSFSLGLYGHGFGLTQIRYDLAAGKGEALATELRVVVGQASGTGRREATLVTVMSSTEIQAEFDLDRTPLEPGVYDIELHPKNGNETYAKLADAFQVRAAGAGDAGVPVTGNDSGVSQGADATGADPDAGVVVIYPDATAAGMDAAPPPDDAGVVVNPDATVFPDAAPPPPDAGAGVDSGLGPWVEPYRFRQQVIVSNPTAIASPAGVTVRIPIDHAQLVVLGRSRNDGRDLALYLGTTRVEHQWESVDGINTNNLVMIASLPEPFSPGPSLGTQLVLYYGDTNGNVPLSDAVFLFSQRYPGMPRSVEGDPNEWFLNRWQARCANHTRPGMGQGFSVCVSDDDPNSGGPTRLTMGSPRVRTLVSNPGPNVVYEMTAHIKGQMQERNDILYFSYSDANNNFPGSHPLPLNAYVTFQPNAQVTFTETTNTQRTVEGWRLPAPPGIEFTLTRARFVPAFDGPSLHFRYISPNSSRTAQTLVQVDDLTVRLALNPEFSVVLAAPEGR